MSEGQIHAVHGGDFFKAIGEDFSSLDRREGVVSADVLDAWYDPSPKAVEAVREHLPWLMKTSPPTHGEGLRRVLSEVRGIPSDNLIIGAGTSSLMYLAFPGLVKPGERVTMLDPTYGEYAHLCGEIIGAEIRRCELLPEEGFRPDLDRLVEAAKGSKLVILVNPNSPTGVGVERGFIEALLREMPTDSWLWVDETYVDLAPHQPTAEPLVASHGNLIVAKSMSKYYSLSGLRVGYLAGPSGLCAALEPMSPPWSIGLIGQLAAVEALRDADYYTARAHETHTLRGHLRGELDLIPGIRCFDSVTNFILFELDKPVAAELVERCAAQGVFLRNCDSLSPRFQGRYIRTAVKCGVVNARIAAVIKDALAGLA